MEPQTKTCQNCQTVFTVESADLDFYEKVKVPPPTFCPQCRLIRRFVWRNERSLYKRKCDQCSEMKIMAYAPESPHKVFCYSCWWSDSWTALDYGRDYDFDRPFFEQFKELLLAVPRPGTIKQGNNTGSEYTNRVTDTRNCYLIYGTTVAEYCRYGVWLNGSKQCLDSYSVQKSERCYGSIDCYECYNVAFSEESNNCTDSWFLSNCRNSQNCFGCVNLRNKSYCIFNEQYTKEDYAKRLAEFNLQSAAAIAKLQAQFEEFKKQFIVPALVSHHSNKASGNWIENSKEVARSFSCADVEEGRYLFAVFQAKDVMDFSFWGNSAELIYEQINSGIQIANVQFGNECWNQAVNMQYVMNCHNSHDLFGCIGLKNAEYCIFNKQYDKEDYFLVRAEIVAQMAALPYTDKKGRTYSYGEFFPVEFSPFGYNETIAHEFFPIEKNEATAQAYQWKDAETKNYQITLESSALPDDITTAPDTITNEIIGCAHAGQCNQQCTTAFRVLAEDLELYKREHFPLPRLCPNCRHFERLARRNPIKLWPGACQCAGTHSKNGAYTNSATVHASHPAGGACPNTFETSYAPERPEAVYCEPCYQAEIA